MKKLIVSIFALIVLSGLTSAANATSYSFDILSGGGMLSVENSSFLSFVTTNDLVVDFEFDLPLENTLMDYTASMNMSLVLLGGFYTYDLEMNDLALGSFQSFDPTGIFGDGISPNILAGSNQFSLQFAQYTLTDATLDYDVTFTPDANISNRYAIRIDELSLYGGNTSDLLSGLINDINQSGQIPIPLPGSFFLPMTLAGSINLQADPVSVLAPVPEPATMLLFGIGCLSLAGIIRRDK